jgi:hypothetical protein
MDQTPAWLIKLKSLHGLTDAEKAQAKVLILAKPESDRHLYVEGTPEEAVLAIKSLLSQAGVDLPIQQCLILIALHVCCVASHKHHSSSPHRDACCNA